MSSALRLREEIDVGYVLFEDLQEKYKFVYSRREEIIDRLSHSENSGQCNCV